MIKIYILYGKNILFSECAEIFSYLNNMCSKINIFDIQWTKTSTGANLYIYLNATPSFIKKFLKIYTKFEIFHKQEDKY